MHLTRNSRDAALSAGEFQDPLSSSSTVVSSDSASSFAEHAVISMPSAVVLAGTSVNQPTPEFLASVVTAVKASLAVECSALAVPTSSSAAILTNIPVSQVGRVPNLNRSLAQRASALFDARVGFPSARAGPPAQSAQGRPAWVFPSCVHFFRFAPLPFMVGHSYSLNLAKLVSQILIGKIVELSKLLSLNITLTEPEPQLLFDGRLVLTLSPKKPK